MPKFLMRTKAINKSIKPLIGHLLSQEPWFLSGRQYYGSVHGEIGILTQIALGDPSYIPKLEVKLSTFLDNQDNDGN
jgi:hypothetical protein